MRTGVHRIGVVTVVIVLGLAGSVSAQLAVPASKIVFPRFEIARKSRSQLRVGNVGAASATVQIQFLCAGSSPGGVCPGSDVVPFTLAPGASRVIDVDDEAPPCTEGAAIATADQPILGSYEFGKGRALESGVAIAAGLAAPVLVSDFRATKKRQGSRIDLVDPAAAIGGQNPERSVAVEAWNEMGANGASTSYRFTCVGSVRLGDVAEDFAEQRLGTARGLLRLTGTSSLLGALSEYRGGQGRSRPLFVQP